jgi:hypothetical protein
LLFDVLDLEKEPRNFSIHDFAIKVPEFQKEYFERRYDMTFIVNSVEKFFQDLQ